LPQSETRSRFGHSRLDIDAWSNAKLACIFAAAVLALTGGLWFFLGWFAPPPRHTLTIAAGPRTGAYYQYAIRYRELLEADGVHARVIETAGTVDNLDRLRGSAPDCCADVAFAQAGPWGSNDAAVQSLAAVGVEPIWIFVDPGRFAPKQLTELRGRKVALGAAGSGTLPVALAMLRLAGVEPNADEARYLGGPAALQALRAGEVAAAFIVASASAPIVDQAVAMGMRVLPVPSALAVERRLPWSHSITLPRGLLSVAGDVPASDVQMLAVNTNLVTRAELHESTKFLLLHVATQVHAEPGPMQAAHRYPSQDGLIFPQGEASKDFFVTGRPWLYKVLPFWSAYQINRVLLSLLPVLLIALSLLRGAINFGERRNRASIMRLLTLAKELEANLIQDGHAFDAASQRALRLLERQIGKFRPLTIHSVDYFRVHDSLQVIRAAARQALERHAAPAGATAPRAPGPAAPRLVTAGDERSRPGVVA
jgi:TRAP-type uncharacterized transport system substrate-binding protein